MRTKIVYVLVSSSKDIYLEQAWASIFSLRKFNSDVDVEILCDTETAKRCEAIREFKKLVNTIISVDFNDGISNKERSRWIKTSMRSLIEGDFLFIDTDTIVTSSLADVDDFSFNIGMVYDWHVNLSERPNMRNICKIVESLYDIDGRTLKEYFNSGVIYCKDTEESIQFFKKWHDNWSKVKDKPKGMFDQPSLAVTVKELGGVNVMPGEYNCQVLSSINYISTAKIVHFFNTNWAKHSLSPFFDKDIYMEIKNDGDISEKNQDLILNCRSTFVSPSMVILNEDINIWRSSIFKLLRKIYIDHTHIYNLINKISQKLLKFQKI